MKEKRENGYESETQEVKKEATEQNSVDVDAQSSARYSLDEKTVIKQGMTEQERYETLKDKKNEVFEDVKSLEYFSEIKDLEDIYARAKSKAEGVIIPLAKKLGILNKSMKTPEVEIDFVFTSNGGLKESLHKQLRYGGNYADFAKAIINLDKVLEYAILIEAHGDKYAETVKANPNLERVYVLFSAFKDGDSIIPIQLEIKKHSHEGGRLYMTVAMTKIKADVVESSVGYKNNLVHSLLSASKYSLSDIFKNVNELDKHFLKYIPDGFLTRGQQQAKQKAIQEDSERRNKYFYEKSSRKSLDVDSEGRELTKEHHDLVSYLRNFLHRLNIYKYEYMNI